MAPNTTSGTDGKDAPVIEMRGIVKRFPGVLANDHVDFDLHRGEIHALLGENGAGKSTLMNVLAGLYRPDAGLICVNGQAVDFASPRVAIGSGIGMIHQHFMLVPSQTVTENILLGLHNPRFVLNLAKYDRQIAELGERYGMKVDPRAKIWQLSVGEQQRVEILKMLYRGAEVLIMDEPTAVLAPQEIEGLFATLRNMVAGGKSVIFISHKLNEVIAISDRVTVLNRGKVTAAGLSTHEYSQADLARLMVGRDVLFRLEKEKVEPGETVLSIEELHAENDKHIPALKGVTFNVRAGEIVGIAGVAGNGQRELAEVITGLRACTQGRVLVSGEDVANHPVRKGIDMGMAHVPEDRTHVGTAPNLNITDNLIMKQYRRPPIAKRWMIDSNAATDYAGGLKEEYDIMAPTLETPTRMLSGGNLQRVILAREFSGQPAVVIAMQPTRGLDVGAIEGVQRLLLEQRKTGAAILLVSEELEELLSLSDRIYVIYEGQIMGELSAEQFDVDQIGLMMTGTSLEHIQSGALANG